MKQTDKKRIIERLVEVPLKNKRPFWAREMTLLKRLLADYPDLDFWSKVNFGERVPSLAYLLTAIGKYQVKRKYNEFTFEIPSPVSYNLGEKIGEDRRLSIPKSIRAFLNE
tara:strand:- start:224 stop:556 length:333 start_codon:yes stop_codon:yes gene_type:complete